MTETENVKCEPSLRCNRVTNKLIHTEMEGVWVEDSWLGKSRNFVPNSFANFLLGEMWAG